MKVVVLFALFAVALAFDVPDVEKARRHALSNNVLGLTRNQLKADEDFYDNVIDTIPRVNASAGWTSYCHRIASLYQTLGGSFSDPFIKCNDPACIFNYCNNMNRTYFGAGGFRLAQSKYYGSLNIGAGNQCTVSPNVPELVTTTDEVKSFQRSFDLRFWPEPRILVGTSQFFTDIPENKEVTKQRVFYELALTLSRGSCNVAHLFAPDATFWPALPINTPTKNYTELTYSEWQKFFCEPTFVNRTATIAWAQLLHNPNSFSFKYHGSWMGVAAITQNQGANYYTGDYATIAEFAPNTTRIGAYAWFLPWNELPDN